MIKEKMYSFNIVTPKRLNNRKIIVKAITQKEGRKKKRRARNKKGNSPQTRRPLTWLHLRNLHNALNLSTPNLARPIPAHAQTGVSWQNTPLWSYGAKWRPTSGVHQSNPLWGCQGARLRGDTTDSHVIVKKVCVEMMARQRQITLPRHASSKRCSTPRARATRCRFLEF